MKGLCPECQQYRWLGGKGRKCKPCAYPVKGCVCCNKKRKIYVDGLCYMCYQDRQVRIGIEELESCFSPKSQYNRQLFELYLTYVRRYRVCYFHLKQTSGLKEILEGRSIASISSWLKIYELAQTYHLPNTSAKGNGHAFIKIGYMLQELGVLPPKVDECGRQTQALLSSFTDQELRWVQPFIDSLKQTNRCPHTLRNYLLIIRNFRFWLREIGFDGGLLCPNQALIEEYLEGLFDGGCKPKYVVDTRNYLNKFYHWCQLERLVLINPCKGIKTQKAGARLVVCSDEQVRKLFNFVKNPKSPPEPALLITLVLFFGLTTEDLVFARLNPNIEELSIILRRKPRTCGRRYYNRDQILKLPRNPLWFIDLQKRFYRRWLDHYAKVKKSYPHYQLFLPYHNNYNRPIGRDALRKRSNQATKAATGMSIPLRVLRQTCGHIYSQNQDASMLARMGWSPSFAFHYTWLPRSYYSEENTDQEY